MPVIVRIEGWVGPRSLQYPDSYFEEVLREGWVVGIVVPMPEVLPPECRCYIDHMEAPTNISNGRIHLRVVTLQ
jgi:hypothetical protein